MKLVAPKGRVIIKIDLDAKSTHFVRIPFGLEYEFCSRKYYTQ
jgi:hypothetical protein